MHQTNKSKRYFDAAEIAAMTSTHRCQIGAVIVYKNKIISAANNESEKTHPMQYKYNQVSKRLPSFRAGRIHAEMAAIIRVRDREVLKKSTMYIFRRNRDGKIGMCRPCTTCMEAIKDYEIGEVCYTTPEGFASELIESINNSTNR
jgi:deoxycytidylate deaminase